MISIWGIAVMLLALFVLMMLVVTVFGVTLLVKTRKERTSQQPVTAAQAHH